MVRLASLIFAAVLLCGAVGIAPRRRDREDPQTQRTAPAQSAPAQTAPAQTAPAQEAGPSERVRIGRRRVETAPVQTFPSQSAPAQTAPAQVSPAAIAPGARVGIQRRDPAYVPSGAGSIQRHSGGVTWHGRRHGSRYYWSRPYAGYWWRWDPFYSRWNYWYGDRWWWYGPQNSLYVVVEDRYEPYSAPAASYAAPYAATPSSPSRWISPDGRRMVELVGADSQALLYDRTAEPPTYLGFLGSGVRLIRFSAAAPGSKGTILVDRTDGGFMVFDENGGRLSPEAAPAAAPPPAAPPSGMPPPPPSDLPGVAP